MKFLPISIAAQKFLPSLLSTMIEPGSVERKFLFGEAEREASQGHNRTPHPLSYWGSIKLLSEDCI